MTNTPNHFSPLRGQAEYGKPSRELLSPDDEAREQHTLMLGLLYNRQLVSYDKLRPETFVAGGMPGSQLLDNVLPHKDSQTFYMLDIKSAFPSVNIARLKEIVADKARPIDVDKILGFIDVYGTTPLTTGLPQGAPCSPYFFNLYLLETDEALDSYCAEKGLAYTRWLDDITISSAEASGVLGETTRRQIRDIIEQTSGMKVNHAKSRLHRRARKPVTITGVSIYPNGRVQPSPAVIVKTIEAFDEVENDVFSLKPITDSHVGLLDGYHGALVSMSQEPYNSMMSEAIERYYEVRRLALAAIEMQSEPTFKPDREIMAILKALMKNIDAQNYRKRNGLPYIEDGRRIIPDSPQQTT